MNAKDIIDALKIIKDECRCHRYCNECEYSFVTMFDEKCMLKDEPGMWDLEALANILGVNNNAKV